MKLLEEKIRTDGIAVNEDILKVDSFINHRVDPFLMQEMGREFAAHFSGQGITKVVTIESSGIAPALTTAIELGVPMVILKKTAVPRVKQKSCPHHGHLFHQGNQL